MTNDKEKMIQTAKQIVDLLSKNHHIETTSVKVIPCATFISYFLEVAKSDFRVMKVSEIENDIALLTSAYGGSVRLTKNNKHLIIEVAREDRGKIALSYCIEEYKKSGLKYELPIALGLDNENKPQFADLCRMGGILMAGTTGSGKSVFENTIIMSLLQLTPRDKVQFFLIDIKRVELAIYRGLPQLFTNVLVDLKDIIPNLKLLLKEKNRRLNSNKTKESFPYIVVVVDTISDLMYAHREEFESLMVELARDSSLSKIHIIMSDSRPQPEVFSDLFKKHFLTRIAGNNCTSLQSREILGVSGAEKLLGSGDLLFFPPDLCTPMRVQAPNVTEKEIGEMVKSLTIK